MDGFETASHIKRRERTRHVPIIFLTAADRDAQLALRGYAVGAVDYLTKPVDLDELLDLMAGWIKGERPENGQNGASS